MFSEQQKLEVLQKYADGQSASSIGGYFKVSEGLITKILKSNNIEIKRKNLPASFDNNIIELYNNGRSIKYITKLYKSSNGRIEKFLIENKVSLRNYRTPRSDIWKPNKELSDEIIQEYNNGKSARQIGFKYCIANVTVTDFLKRNNIKIRKHPEANRMRYGYGLNENVFDEINEESAYWIGFILSDGNVYKGDRNSNSINFGLKESDWEHLEKLKKFLGCTKPLYRNNKSVFIAFYSKKIQDKLAEFGIVPCKSKIAKVPELLKNNKHFWRGVIDGDGWVTFNKSGYPTMGLCGTLDIVNSFIKLIGKMVDAKQRDINKNFAQIAYHTTSAQIICKYLYNNSKIYLNRKYENYKKICKWKPQYIQNRSSIKFLQHPPQPTSEPVL